MQAHWQYRRFLLLVASNGGKRPIRVMMYGVCAGMWNLDESPTVGHPEVAWMVIWISCMCTLCGVLCVVSDTETQLELSRCAADGHALC